MDSQTGKPVTASRAEDGAKNPAPTVNVWNGEKSRNDTPYGVFTLTETNSYTDTDTDSCSMQKSYTGTELYRCKVTKKIS